MNRNTCLQQWCPA